MRTKALFALLALLVVFVSGCIEETEEIVLDEPGNASSYEFEVFVDEGGTGIPANTTTYYPLGNTTEVRVVNMVIDASKLEMFPTESFGGSSEEVPIENLVLLVEPSNTTEADLDTFQELSERSELSDLNYTLTRENRRNMKVINLDFEENVTGFIAYTLKMPGAQNLAIMRPDSEFIRVVIPEGYATGNRVFGIPRPEPYAAEEDELGRQTFLWIASEMDEREQTIQVKYYRESSPLYFFAAIVALLFGVVMVFVHYSRSKKELLKVREIFELEKEYEEKEKRKRK
ncbi:MAG: DUF5803 family protein [Methanosarcinaceae archaeon]|uniref:DUF5803 family protein n=1 Tax=Methanosarcina sp. MTP4 TaxID=1434100 RepID=UPI001E599E6A|nr:DUF5803 family protein [Methanosarcina sp. MTP4]